MMLKCQQPVIITQKKTQIVVKSNKESISEDKTYYMNWKYQVDQEYMYCKNFFIHIFTYFGPFAKISSLQRKIT